MKEYHYFLLGVYIQAHALCDLISCPLQSNQAQRGMSGGKTSKASHKYLPPTIYSPLNTKIEVNLSNEINTYIRQSSPLSCLPLLNHLT